MSELRSKWKRFLTHLREMQRLHVVDLIVIAVIVVIYGVNFYNGICTAKVVITPLDDGADHIVLRGAYVDDAFYHASDLYKSGDWEKGPYFCTSNDLSPVTLEVPCGRNVQLLFFVGPDQGSAEISVEGEKEEILSFWNDTLDENGQAFPVNVHGARISDTIMACVVVFLAVLLLWIVWEFVSRKISEKLLEGIFIAMLLPLAVGTLYYLSVSSTPRVPENINMFGYDAASYRFIGRGWLNGYIPYRDLLEQKGPLIFFVYMLGEWINSHWGVFALQSLCLWITLTFAFLTAKQFCGTTKAFISTLATLLFFTLVIDEGALVEEFNLPVLAISVYLAVKYFVRADGDVEHPPKYAFVYGVACAVSLCMRVTNCIAICCFVAYITVLLLVKKKFSNLVRNMGMFVAGVVCVLLPIVLYFLANGALDDMIDGYLFQFLYTGQAVAQPVKSHEQVQTMFLYMSPVLACAVLSFEKNIHFKVAMPFCAIMSVFMMSKLFLFPHYYIIFIVFVPIAVSWFLEENIPKRLIPFRYKIIYFTVAVSLVASVSMQCLDAISSRDNWVTALHDMKEPLGYSREYKEMGDKIPVEDRDKVFGYNLTCDWWLVNDMFPCRRFTQSEGWLSSVVSVWRDEIMENYNSLVAEWIVVDGTIQDEEIAQVVEEHYSQYYSIDLDQAGHTMTLYKKNS